MAKRIAAFLLLVTAWMKLSAGDDFCGLRNTAFQSGETIEYTIFYNVIGIYVNAGSASFKTSLEKLGSKTVYHVIGDGSSNSKYDWIFKVRDKYESFFDTANLQPLKFVRNVNEGGYKKYENVTFNQQTNT